jgi:hypothetical protein
VRDGFSVQSFLKFGCWCSHSTKVKRNTNQWRENLTLSAFILVETNNTMNDSPKQNRLKKIKDFALKNIKWALLISLVGGVPGLINIYNWSTQSPKFVFATESLLMSPASIKGKSNSTMYSLILSGGIYNDGSKPLFPNKFLLKIKYIGDFNSTVLNSVPITNFQTTGNVEYENAKQNDLLKIIRVNPSDVSYGILLFLSSVPLRQLSEIESMEVICVDILSKERSSKVDFENVLSKGGVVSPKTGTYISD